MGANATTSVPKYTAGDVLTAANLSITNSGIPVFANSTDRTNAFGGTGEKTLAEGQFAYLEDDNKTYYYDGAAWQEVGGAGLKYITGASFSAVTSVSLPNNTFTSTYRNYRVIFDLTGASTTTAITMRVRVSGADKSDANYWQGSPGSTSGGVASNQGDASATSWSMGGVDSGFPFYSLSLDVYKPNISSLEKTVAGNLFYFDGTVIGRAIGGRKYETPAVQIDSLSLIKASGNFTGTYRVYGYGDS